MRCAVYVFHSLTESGMTALEVAEIFGSRHTVVSERGSCGSVLLPVPEMFWLSIMLRLCSEIC